MFANAFARLKSRSNTWEGVDVVFMVSTGRTATKFFSGFFHENFEGIVARHEPAPDLFSLGVKFIRKQNSFKKTRSLIASQRSHICKEVQKFNASVYLESNNNAALLLSVINEVFPNCKLVYIKRDPRSYLVSAYSKVHGNPGYSLYSANDPRPRLTPHDFENDALTLQWKDFNRFEKLCWHWKKYNELITESAGIFADCLTLKYEDLFDEGNLTAIRQLIDFVGLSREKILADSEIRSLLGQRSNQSDSYLLPAFEDWDTGYRDRFYDILGSELEKYGYS